MKMLCWETTYLESCLDAASDDIAGITTSILEEIT